MAATMLLALALAAAPAQTAEGAVLGFSGQFNPDRPASFTVELDGGRKFENRERVPEVWRGGERVPTLDSWVALVRAARVRLTLRGGAVVRVDVLADKADKK